MIISTDPMKTIFRFVLFFFAICPFVSSGSDSQKCELNFKKANLCGNISWTVAPKHVEMVTEKDKSEFVLDLTPKSGKPFSIKSGDQILVKLFMPSMGHGSHPTQVERALDSTGKAVEGKFKVKNVFFTMSGKWEIRIEIKNGKKIRDQAKLDYVL